MIKINLLKSFTNLDSEYLKEQDLAKSAQIDFFKRFLVIASGPIALFAYESYNIPELMNQRNNLNTEYSDLVTFNQKKEAITAEIKKYEQDKARLDRQTQFLEKISKERLLPAEMILRLREIIPAEVWINSIITSGNKLEFKGESISTEAFNQFEEKMRSLPIFTNFIMGDVEEVSVGTNSKTNANLSANDSNSSNSNQYNNSIRVRKFSFTIEYAVQVQIVSEVTQ